MRRLSEIAAALLLGCGSMEVPADAGDASTDSAPEISSEQWAVLRALRYDEGAPPSDPSNAFADDADAAILGQRLFFDPALSGRLLAEDNDGTPLTLGRQGESGRVSCASCHVPEGNFYDTRSQHGQISLASQWTRRRSPTLLEIGFATLYNWDGRRDTLWNQALGVIESPVEFNSSRLYVAQLVHRTYRAEYESIFGEMPALDVEPYPQLAAESNGCDREDAEEAICRGIPGDGAEYDGLEPDRRDAVTRVAVNATKAIAAYLRQLRCGPGRFDAWVDGDMSALSPSEQRGALLFIGRGDCVRCHSGPSLTDQAFHNVGMRAETVALVFRDDNDRGAGEGIAAAIEDPLNARGVYSDGDRGLLPTAVGAEHEGAFRTPTLRCTELSPSFMHTGQMRTLERVISFFDRGGDPAGSYVGTSEIAPLGLSETERADLAAFLRTLEGPGPDPALRAPLE
jgi:cytochrome c peroxidase